MFKDSHSLSNRSSAKAAPSFLTRGIRLVFAAALVCAPLKTSAQGGEVTDKGLTWRTYDNGKPLTWNAAGDYCKSQEGRFLSNWRLPDAEEMRSLWRGFQYLDDLNFTQKPAVLWTSTTQGDKAQVFIPGPNGGTLYWLPQMSAKPMVLCVRTHHFWERY